MGGVRDYVTSSYKAVAQTFAQIRDELHGQESTQEQDVAISTNAAFAQVDLALMGLAWGDCDDGEIPGWVQIDAINGIQQITRDLQDEGKAQSTGDAFSKARGAAEAIANLAVKLEPADKLESKTPAATVDLSESNLDSRDFLQAGIRKCLRILYDTLIQQFGCCNANHFGRLKLTGFINQLDAQSRRFFDVYLSSRYDFEPCRWIESRCTIADSLEKREKPNCAIIQSSELKNRNLNLLLQNNQHQMEVKSNETAQSQRIPVGGVQLDHCAVIESSARPTISLWELLRQAGPGFPARSLRRSTTFYPRDRDTICLNLAMSLLQLSGDVWSKVKWCSDESTSIFFLDDPDTQTILDKTRPYLSWRLEGVAENENEEKHELLCDRQLLDFAQVLVEIHEWKRLPSEIEEQKAVSKEHFRLALFEFVNQNFRECHAKFTSAVKACLDIAGKSSRDPSDPEKMQNYIFQKIMLPLDSYLGNPVLPKSTLTNGQPPEPENVKDLYDGSVEYDEPEDKSCQADAFFHEMRRFTERHISVLRSKITSSKSTKSPKRKIRIAVIDSGVRKDDSRICGWRSGTDKKIRECRNFASPDPKEWNDEVGHGTMVTCLLLDVAPEAELYVAKVSSQKTIPKNKLHRIAKAINWAVQKWEVDIITISLALSEEDHDINLELGQALDPSYENATGKIVFAAAGNKGGNEQRAWPARKHGVIAIHATDGYGAAANINPNGDEGHVNFATLGRNIRMPWLYDVNTDEWKDRYISGTSFATPIAAGIAANVLEFARHRLKMNKRREDRLFSHDGMRKILTAMSARKGDYHYVQPWTMWEKAEKGDWGDRNEVVLSPGDPENICKVLKFIIGES